MLGKENLKPSHLRTNIYTKNNQNQKIEDSLKQHFYGSQNTYLIDVALHKNTSIKHQKFIFNTKVTEISYANGLYWKKIFCYSNPVFFYCKKHLFLKQVWKKVQKQIFYSYLELLKSLHFTVSKIVFFEILSFYCRDKSFFRLLQKKNYECIQQNKNFNVALKWKKSQIENTLQLFKIKLISLDQIIFNLLQRFFLNKIYFFTKKKNIFYLKNFQALNFIGVGLFLVKTKTWFSKIYFTGLVNGPKIFTLENKFDNKKSFAKHLQSLFIKSFLKKSYWKSVNLLTRIFYIRNSNFRKISKDFGYEQQKVKLNIWKKNSFNVSTFLKRNKKWKQTLVQKQTFMHEPKSSFYTIIQKLNKKLFLFKEKVTDFAKKELLIKNLKNFRNYLLILQKEKKERIRKKFFVLIKKNISNRIQSRQRFIYVLRKALKNQNSKKFTPKKLLLNLLKLVLKPSRNNKFKKFFSSTDLHKNVLFAKKKSNSEKHLNSNWISKWKSELHKYNFASLTYLFSLLKLRSSPEKENTNNTKLQLYAKKGSERKNKALKIKSWNEHDVVLTKFKLQINNLKGLIYFFTKNKVSVIFINALSITKFNWILEKQFWSKKMRLEFFKNMQKRFFTKYRTSAIYLKDLLCISFFSFFLKKPTFLLNFIAFQLVHIQKNKKETVLIRFLVKTLKSFANQRSEITGLRIKFRGRVNRWRRTKSIVGSTKYITFQSIHSRLEYGTAKAINKKGVIGIRLWIAYAATFQYTLKNATFNYTNYSRILYKDQIKKLVFPFGISKSPLY